jgi:pantothenate kinase
VKAPSFSHAVKDPVPDDIVVGPKHEIVLIEGLYVALDVEPWATAARLLDERWVIDLEEKLAEERIWRRHVVSGICDSEQSARARAVNNDIPSESPMQFEATDCACID